MVEPERAPGLRAGWVRLYVEARTEALLSGPPLTGAALRYLADVPLDGKGKVPKLAKRSVLLFARAVAGRPGELQLVAPDAQVLWGPQAEARLRGVLGELLAPGAPGRVNKVREAIYVPGNLAGEGETQLFLDTADGEPATITVVHKPGDPPRWRMPAAPRQNARRWFGTGWLASCPQASAKGPMFPRRPRTRRKPMLTMHSCATALARAPESGAEGAALAFRALVP